MMEKFRNLSNNILFKIFLAFLGLTFVMFGVSGFILGSNNNWVAKVGKTTIQYNQFLQSLQDNKDLISRSNNSPEVLEYVQSNQFREDVLQQIITKNLIQSLKKEFQIYPNNQLLLREIIYNPNFQDKDRKFDRNLYTNFLKENRLSEQQHIANIGDETAGKLIIQSIIAPQSFNQNLAKDLNRYRFETRDVDLIFVSTKNVANPNQFELNEFFEKNKSKFALLEMRKVSFVRLDIEAFKKQIIISDEEALKHYRANRGDYQNPQLMSFYHILLDDRLEADEFLRSATSQSANLDPKQIFAKMAIDKGKEVSSIFLKNISSKSLPKEISNDVFLMQENQYSKVFKSNMGFHIFYATKINPPVDIPFIEAKDAVKAKLLAAREGAYIKGQFQAIEDEILATNSIDKVAEKFDLDVDKTLPKFSSEGRDSRNIKVQADDDFIKNSFELAANKVSKILYSNTDKNYYIFLVEEIEPARQRSLEEVKVMAIDLWIENQKQQKLQELANEISKKINEDIGNVNSVVGKYGLKIIKQLKLPRFYAENNANVKSQYEDKLLNNIFATTLNQATVPNQINNDEQVIAIVRNIQTPKMSEIDEKSLMKTVNSLQGDSQSDILDMFNRYIQKEFPVEINQKLMNSGAKAQN